MFYVSSRGENNGFSLKTEGERTYVYLSTPSFDWGSPIPSYNKHVTLSHKKELFPKGNFYTLRL